MDTPAILTEDAEYIGVCALNAPGGWTRSGPTWKTKHGYLTYGPGVARWGTTMGLAELAAATTARPQFHATAWALAPQPNLLFLYTEEAINSQPQVKQALQQTSHLIHNTKP